MISKLFISILLAQTTELMTAFSTQRVFVSMPAKRNIKIVSDLMTQDPFTLSPSTSVDEAIRELLAAGVSGAPVVERHKSQDGKMQLSLVGFVSSFDFLPKEESGLIMLGEMEDSETARRILGQSVNDIMTRNPITVTSNDSMQTASEVMAKHRLHVLPVVDAHHGKLVGVISAKDVMRDVMSTAIKALPSPSSEEFFESTRTESETENNLKA